MILRLLIVTRNSARFLPACLAACERTVSHAATDFPLHVHQVLVDNASSDETLAQARQLAPQARIVALPENVGFAAAVNRGATGTWDVLWLLNPDTVPERRSLYVLLQRLHRTPGVGAVGPALVDKQGRIAPESAREFPTLWREATDKMGLARRWPGHPLWGRYYLGQRMVPGRVPALSGAALLLNRRAWDAVGGLDERFCLYAEDTDLCRRLWDQGWACFYEPEARVGHVGQGSISSEERLWVGLLALESLALYFQKHGDPERSRAYRRLMAWIARLKWLYWRIRGDAYHVRVQEAIIAWSKLEHPSPFLAYLGE